MGAAQLRADAPADVKDAAMKSMKAMGAENVKTLTLTGEGVTTSVGQPCNPHEPYWRKYNAKGYSRAIDLDMMAWHTQFTRTEGDPKSCGGAGTTNPAPDTNTNQVTTATPMNFNNYMEYVFLPEGFLKTAMQKSDATVKPETVKGKKYTVISFTVDNGGNKAPVKGYIDSMGYVSKVETMININPIGDSVWDAEYTGWKDFGGVKFPTHIVQHQYEPIFFEATLSDVKINAPVDLTPAARGGGRGGAGGAPGAGGAGRGGPGGAPAAGGPAGGAGRGGPGGAPGAGGPGGGAGRGGPGGPGVAAAGPGGAPGGGRGGAGAAGGGGGRGGGGAAPVTDDDLGNGAWLITGGYGAVVVNFKDYIVVVEGPSDEARGDTIIAEAKKLVPGKPIRYIINTHAHFDHAAGLRPFVAEGATIVTHEGNKGYWEHIMQNPHTLVPDKLWMMNQHPKVKVEYVGESKKMTGGDNEIDLYHIDNSMHNDAMLMIYLPKQKVLIEADEFNVLNPIPTAPVPNPNKYQVNLLDNIERLKLDVARIVPIHLPTPQDRKVPLSELKLAAGVAGN
jgi:glyoxylase-like metal-dependent hydrolase (beta-lactamase superfamily II)